MSDSQNVGKIVEIRGVVLDAAFEEHLPGIYSALTIDLGEGRTLIAEVQQHLGDDRVRAVAMDATDGLARGSRSIDTGGPITVPVGSVTLGRIFNVLGEPIDKGEPGAGGRRPSAGRSTASRRAFDELDPEAEILETGIKVVDLLAPVHEGRQDRPLRRRRRRQDGADPGADQQHRDAARRPLGVRRRRRAHARGQRPLARDDRVRRHLKTALVFGQMNEPPGARLRVALSGLTMAEYFRDDEGQDVLLFIDNIFRFTQAGSEVSALLGRMPSAVGYQPTLATEMGQLQERITSTKKGSITSVQAIYVPADDLTDPAPATTFAHLDATTVLSRDDRGAGHLPGRRSARLDLAHPPARTSSATSTTRVATRRAAGAPALQGPAGHHRDPRHGRALRRGQADRRSARARSSASSRSRSTSPRSSPARPASTSSSRTRSAASRRSCDGKHDDLPEQAFYLRAASSEVIEAAEQMKAGRGLACRDPATSSRPRARILGRGRDGDRARRRSASWASSRATRRSWPAQGRRDPHERRRRDAPVRHEHGYFMVSTRRASRSCWWRRPAPATRSIRPRRAPRPTTRGRGSQRAEGGDESVDRFRAERDLAIAENELKVAGG